MRIRYLTVAQTEIADAAEYYAAVSPGLGTAFKKELRQLMRLVAALPDELLVLAVGHQHRQPGYWRERLEALK